MRLGSTIVRWIFAPVAAAAGFGLGLFVAFTLLMLTRLPAGEARVGLDAVEAVLAVAFAMVGWVWAGAATAPPRHRTFAFMLFSVPPVLMGLVFLPLLAAGRVTPERVPIGLGAALGCGGIIILRLIWRHRARAAERRRTLQQTAEIFSDET